MKARKRDSSTEKAYFSNSYVHIEMFHLRD